jgi:hypothetical protein
MGCVPSSHLQQLVIHLQIHWLAADVGELREVAQIQRASRGQRAGKPLQVIPDPIQVQHACLDGSRYRLFHPVSGVGLMQLEDGDKFPDALSFGFALL